MALDWKVVFINFFIYIEIELISIIMMSNLKFIDLFVGYGGLSLGLKQADFHLFYINELKKEGKFKKFIIIFFK